jgi:CDP-6-deoxy-D-xylo-4-hexulose-3-dehydrase
MSADPDSMRPAIAHLVRDYYAEAFRAQPFVPGTTPVPVSGRVFDADELQLLVDSALDFWLTTGRYADLFERDFAAAAGRRFALLTNSGSSANLLAISALTSPKLGNGRLRPGDEVVTVAAGFPTTVNPIIQNGLIPVFVDITLPTYNADLSAIEAALSPKTRAVMLAHTLGNPFDAAAVRDFCVRNGLWLIEDCCDALGSLYDGALAGTFGHLSTYSFYPAHHITMGEGGSVATDDPLLMSLVASFRDWGRDCRCAPGVDDTCHARYRQTFGDLPAGYDHKYVYTHLGYNLKATDMQAAVGVAQLKKLPSFIRERRKNFSLLTEGLRPLSHHFIFPEPTPKAKPAWFGYPITIRPEAPFSRTDLLEYLASCRIGARLLFGGNLTRQPAYSHTPYRVSGSLDNTDQVMRSTFWIGTYPGLTPDMLTYTVDRIAGFSAGDRCAR